MIRCTIDGARMGTRATAHQEIARALELLVYYGSNLDALWDMASTIEADVTLIHPGAMLNALQQYGCKLIATLYEAAGTNERFQFRIAD